MVSLDYWQGKAVARVMAAAAKSGYQISLAQAIRHLLDAGIRSKESEFEKETMKAKTKERE